MKFKYVGITFAMLLLMVTVTAAGAAGLTSTQLGRAGRNCFNDGPNNWTHCIKKDPADGPSAIPVKVFSVDGNEFLGTELLIRADLYNGQPCPQEGGGEYHLLPFGYYACHHA